MEKEKIEMYDVPDGYVRLAELIGELAGESQKERQTLFVTLLDAASTVFLKSSDNATVDPAQARDLVVTVAGAAFDKALGFQRGRSKRAVA